MSNHPVGRLLAAGLVVVGAALMFACSSSAAPAAAAAPASPATPAAPAAPAPPAAPIAPTAAVEQVAFATPEAAVQALAEAVESDDPDRGARMFGADGIELLRSGDPVADRAAAERVRAEIVERVAFEDREDGSKTALLGADGWPFPVPLRKASDGWRFDVAAGWEEIENRRIGGNELYTIATLHHFVDAQREYASVGRDGQPPAYAAKLFSSEGKHDGLYWPTAEGEPTSPMGEQVAAAAAEGYARSEEGGQPFHGYRYRLLTAQGPSAPGGARSYLDAEGRLTGGFALLAWPAKYGNSGVMTFVVNRQGLVYQRDLGEETEAAAAAIVAYDPDDDWEPTGDE